MVYALVVSFAVLAAAAAILVWTAGRLRRKTVELRQAVEQAAAARDQAQVLLSVAEAVNSSLSLEDVIDVALSRCVHLVRAPAGAFYMARPGRVELTREASIGLAAKAHGAVRPLTAEPMLTALNAPVPVVVELHPDAAPGLDAGGHPAFVLIVPIRRGTQLMGALELYLPNQPLFPSSLTELLKGIGAQAATAIRHAQIYREQEESSLTDELTRLPNRRYLGQRFLQERQRARRTQKYLGILMLDLDHFKAINDSHGHLIGDAVLSHLASIIRGSVRDSDVAARYGGEEFAVIVQETDLNGAMRLAGRIRTAVEQAVFPSGLRLTVSIGVACTDDAERFGNLFELADSALYKAKRSGRNQVQAALIEKAKKEPSGLHTSKP